MSCTCALPVDGAPVSLVADVDLGDDAATEDDDALERPLILALLNTVD